jgi:hypothetical protein
MSVLRLNVILVADTYYRDTSLAELQMNRVVE